jgi:NADPH:quinone reductase-like Zn-dependent oxidoreductase
VGYSNAGMVRATGSSVRRFRAGDRVFSTRPHQSAYIADERELLIRIPDAVSSEQASLTYLTGLGLAALRQARYETGENIVVIGLGVIGLSTIGLANAMGANAVGIANSEIKRIWSSSRVIRGNPIFSLSMSRASTGAFRFSVFRGGASLCRSAIRLSPRSSTRSS